METEKMRRQREELRSTILINEEHVRSADQDRHLMMSGLEQQRQKLQDYRKARADALAEKERLTESALLLHSKWTPPHTLPVPQPQTAPLPTAPGRRETVFRDKKGVPNSISYHSAAPSGAARMREQWQTFSSNPSRNIVSSRRASAETRVTESRAAALVEMRDSPKPSERLGRPSEPEPSTEPTRRRGNKRRSRSRKSREEVGPTNGSLGEFDFGS
eukprot:Protomagalhaensia_wolfi_Nauph_80__2583@NODE_2731_length_1003_cov_3_661826_g2139_i0_p1_GENE_NODE_2731_length_1003_cov_3_661826_g2139_i0NODE_2731_length_1003_cov_3_661826_g2139_i0_p1_ORF_typecomplete_len217_score26_67UPF0242/PF06785_11/1_2_NODE_2731_length_1003_cov_3_661826_g2139_i015665